MVPVLDSNSVIGAHVSNMGAFIVPVLDSNSDGGIHVYNKLSGQCKTFLFCRRAADLVEEVRELDLPLVEEVRELNLLVEEVCELQLPAGGLE